MTFSLENKFTSQLLSTLSIGLIIGFLLYSRAQVHLLQVETSTLNRMGCPVRDLLRVTF